MKTDCKDGKSQRRRKVLHFPKWVESWKIHRAKDGRWQVIGESAIDSETENSHNTH